VDSLNLAQSGRYSSSGVLDSTVIAKVKERGGAQSFHSIAKQEEPRKGEIQGSKRGRGGCVFFLRSWGPGLRVMVEGGTKRIKEHAAKEKLQMRKGRAKKEEMGHVERGDKQ